MFVFRAKFNSDLNVLYFILLIILKVFHKAKSEISTEKCCIISY